MAKKKTEAKKTTGSDARQSSQTKRRKPSRYFISSQDKNIQFIDSGCELLNQALGGGWATSRVTNIVGDKSSGKTLLAIEKVTNFLRQFPKGKVWYVETEAAFDPEYAEALGMPMDKVKFVDHVYTVEDLFNNMEEVLDEEGDEPGLYIVDSLDALSDASEQERKIDDNTYGAQKAKKMSELFRRLNQQMEGKRIGFTIISQVRENIGGGPFGPKHDRSGGKALDFYASQVLNLKHVQELKKTRKKVERVYGIKVAAKVTKNKVGLPLRKCEFDILFGYGIDDVKANLNWLESLKRHGDAGFDSAADLQRTKRDLDKMSDEEFLDVSKRASEAVKKVWPEIEEEFMPKRRKY